MCLQAGMCKSMYQINISNCSGKILQICLNKIALFTVLDLEMLNKKVLLLVMVCTYPPRRGFSTLPTHRSFGLKLNLKDDERYYMYL